MQGQADARIFFLEGLQSAGSHPFIRQMSSQMSGPTPLQAVVQRFGQYLLDMTQFLDALANFLKAFRIRLRTSSHGGSEEKVSCRSDSMS